VEKQIDLCLQKCRDDLKGMTRYVTWDTDGKGGSSALYRSLPTPKKMVEIYSVAVEKEEKSSKDGKKSSSSGGGKRADKIVEDWTSHGGDSAIVPNVRGAAGGAVQLSQHSDDAKVSDYYDLLQLTEEMLAGRNAGRTNTVVTALVQYIIRSWRDHFARTVAMKFNCFFLMPFLDDFPAFLRDELDEMYEAGAGEMMFDIMEARSALQGA
jgi:hypothetical protein